MTILALTWCEANNPSVFLGTVALATGKPSLPWSNRAGSHLGRVRGPLLHKATVPGLVIPAAPSHHLVNGLNVLILIMVGREWGQCTHPLHP